MGNAIDNLRHLIDCYGWRDSRDMQDFIDAADMIDMQYVELPKDTDGERIHVGDMIKLPNCKSEEVRFMTINGAGWLINESGWLPYMVSHSKPDTWEQIIMDAIRGDGRTYGCLGERFEATVPALVARCKALAGDAE